MCVNVYQINETAIWNEKSKELLEIYANNYTNHMICDGFGCFPQSPSRQSVGIHLNIAPKGQDKG